jgi:hypothetical protein
MALSWNEIRDRALQFSKEWENTSNEEADAKPFLVAFFNVFGISNKRVATFEYRVKKLDNKDGYIDMLWKGTLLVEMKSRGKNLNNAFAQAKEYLHGLKQHELPKYILVCDFETFRLYDLESDENDGLGANFISFKLKDLFLKIKHFNFIIGYPKQIYKEQDPANIKAAELMGKLHDRLEEIGYTGHPLEVYLVRILFLLFAEDTSIFQKQQFQDYIEKRTNEDGSDLAAKLQELFQVLNTPNDKRYKNIDEQLADFAYINGKLFEEILPTASFDKKMKEALLECCYIDWSRISPAIFGSMFQSVMNPKERRNLGAHYTSETNILKLIKPLFLDDLYKEFDKVKNNDTALVHFHNKIATLRFLDPACGCGNFLIITYRELRLLELQVILERQKLDSIIHQMNYLDVSMFFQVNVDKFYGIEYEEFPARIAEVAMWLIDHQMNMFCNAKTGNRLFRIPLVKSANITNGNALQMEWSSLLSSNNEVEIKANEAEIIIRQSYSVQEPAMQYGKVKLVVEHYKIVDEFSVIKPDTKYDYIIGNPPFSGSKIMSQNMRNDVAKAFGGSQGSGVLDYVAAWYIKAAKYMLRGTSNTHKTKAAFVSTNSIVQGEQVSILWGQMLNKYNIKIHFAHRTFKWSNEAKGNAAVYCVIIGFANFDTKEKIIYDYEDIKGDAHEIKVSNINPYLVDAKDILIEKRRKPICNVPKIVFGNMPNDGGNLLLSNEEKETLLLQYPEFEKYIKPLIGAYEFLNGLKKWCFWFVGFDEKSLKENKELKRRIDAIKKLREKSTRPSTQALSKKPTLFGEIRQPENEFIYVPLTSSENRWIVPMGFFNCSFIPNNTGSIIPNASLYHFGVLQSKMHHTWVKYVCGKLKSDFRYSNEIVYNNFPWAIEITDKQKQKIELAAQEVLDARKARPTWGVGDFYDPLLGIAEIIKAHNKLDKAVDLAYRLQPFSSEAKRMEFLFELYEKYTANLFTKEKTKKTKAR